MCSFICIYVALFIFGHHADDLRNLSSTVLTPPNSVDNQELSVFQYLRVFIKINIILVVTNEEMKIFYSVFDFAVAIVLLVGCFLEEASN